MEHVNEIVLVGRLSGVPEWKALTGDEQVAVWRLIVEHRNARSPQDAIDTIRCVTYDAAVQEDVRGWGHGDVIEVRGALRHRFWRASSGPRGLYEVEAAHVVRRMEAPPPRTRAVKARTAASSGAGGAGGSSTPREVGVGGADPSSGVVVPSGLPVAEARVVAASRAPVVRAGALVPSGPPVVGTGVVVASGAAVVEREVVVPSGPPVAEAGVVVASEAPVGRTNGAVASGSSVEEVGVAVPPKGRSVRVDPVVPSDASTAATGGADRAGPSTAVTGGADRAGPSTARRAEPIRLIPRP